MRRLAYLLLLLGAASVPGRPDETARPSPPFTILRPNGPAVRLSQYRGKVVAVAFIQTECPHCQQLTTELNLIAAEYKDRGVQILECAFDVNAAAALPRFLERFKPPFPVGYSTTAAVMAYLQYTIIDPRPMTVPQMVFLDRTGVIRAQYAGESEFFRDPGPNVRMQLEKMAGAGKHR